MRLLTIIITSTFFLLLNVFAVIGLICTIKTLVKAMTRTTNDNTKRTDISKAKRNNTAKTQPARQPKKPTDYNILFLNAGLVMLWLSTVLFGSTNKFISSGNSTQWFLLSYFLISFVLSYLLTLHERTKASSKLLLDLTLFSFVYFAILYWFRNLSETSYIYSHDYFFILSFFLGGMSLMYHLNFKQKVYLVVFSLCLQTMIIFSSFSFITIGYLRVPYILLGNAVIYLVTRFLFRKDPAFKSISLPIFRLSDLLFGLLQFILVIINLYGYNDPLVRSANIVALFIPLVFTLIVWVIEKRSITLLLEGLLFPWKMIIALSVMFVGFSTYHSWIVCIILFVGSLVFSMTRFYKLATVRRFLFPLQLSSILSALILMSIRPIHKDVIDTLPIALTLLALNVALVVKSNKYKLHFMRLIEPFIQLSIIGTLMYAFESNFRVDSFNFPVIAITSMIPATIHLVGMILTENKRKSVYLVFNTLFLLTAGVVLSLSDPTINLVISGYTLLVMILLTYLSKVPQFGIAITAISISTLAALLNMTGQDGVTLLIIISVLLAVLGNLWRFPLMFGHDDKMLNETLRYIKRAAILSAIPILLFSFLTIHFNNHLILLQYLALSIMFLTAPIKGSKFRLIAGVGPILAFWHLLNISDTPKYANAQLYAFPVVIITLAAVCRAKQDIFDTKRPLLRSEDRTDRIFAFIGTLFAVTLPMNIALVQSMYDPSPFNLIQGGTLLMICIVLLVFAMLKKYTLLKYISIVYIFAEFAVLIWRYSQVIPWWIYPAVIGIALLTFSLRTMIGISDEMKDELNRR